MKRPLKITLRVLGILACLAILVAIIGVLILRSNWFHEKVRARIVYEVERATGGRSEVGSFKFDWQTLTAEVAPFVLHGTEPTGEKPLFQADAITVGLRIISIAKKDIDIDSLTVQRPQLNLLIGPNGVSNFPKPNIPRTQGKDPVERLVDLAVGKIVLREGLIRYADRKFPLEINGERLNAALDYNFTDPSYGGALTFEKLTIQSKHTLPISASLNSRVRLFPTRLEIDFARLGMRDSEVQLSGSVRDFKDIHVNLNASAHGSLAELGRPLRLPEPHVGNMQFKGTITYNAGESLRIAGRATGQGLAVRQGGVHIRDIAIASDLKFDTKYLGLTGLRVDALDGRFDGMFELRDLKTYAAKGKATGLSVVALTRLAGMKGQPFSGAVSGPLEVRGSWGANSRDLKAAGRFDVVAETGAVPIGGFVEVAYDRARQSLQLGNSYLTLPSSRVDFRGTIGTQLEVRAQSKNLDDLLPLIASFSDSGTTQLPLRLLPAGAAEFTGLVTGPLTDPRATGSLSLNSFVVQEQQVDRLVATVDATRSGAQVSSFAMGQGQLRLEGSAAIGLDNWRFTNASSIDSKLKLDNAQIAALLAKAGQKLPIDGLLSATGSATGTAADMKIAARIDIQKPTMYGEIFDRIRAEIKYAGQGVEVIDGVADIRGSRVVLSGAYQHPVNDWRNGTLRFELGTGEVLVERFENVRKLQGNVTGELQLKATGVIDVRNGALLPQAFNGDMQLQQLSLNGKPLGTLQARAKTAGQDLSIDVNGDLRGSKVNGNAHIRLTGNYASNGKLAFTQIAVSTLQDLFTSVRSSQPLPMEGLLQGGLTFDGPLRKPEEMTAQVELSKLQVYPNRKSFTDVRAEQLYLSNDGPVALDYKDRTLRIRTAHLVGRDTDLKAAGTINFQGPPAYEVRVDGQVNLGIAQLMHADIVSSGLALVNASIRGPLQNPSLGGRIDLKNASFYLADFPNGLDNANGSIVFDRQRANIERLTAQTGGGDVVVSGFLGFGREPSYQLQARATSVRIRYPEGVSTTANATLNLTGSTNRSLMTGVVTIQRAGFNPRTDVGGLLAASAKPLATPTTPNEFLRNMQFDVRLETIPNLQFQTSLTQDLQAEADLRLRGTAAKPVVLGRVVVNQGEIQFFGTKYIINRGEIGFFNPVKVEPVLDMDLETRVRGVLVNINFTGTLSKLNVSYRSDPPLQSNEIVALLAVGRAPSSNSSLASTQANTNQGLFSGGPNLLGQAVAAPVSSRLQRFFGVSKLKIDPQLTGLNAIPQARLTIEQQISRDITLTYITNLSQANQQVIRLEWDINRTWSVVALREENGVFGIDFLFKRRFQ